MPKLAANFSMMFHEVEMLDRFEKFQHLGDYIRSKRKELEEHNQEAGADP